MADVQRTDAKHASGISPSRQLLRHTLQTAAEARASTGAASDYPQCRKDCCDATVWKYVCMYRYIYILHFTTEPCCDVTVCMICALSAVSVADQLAHAFARRCKCLCTLLQRVRSALTGFSTLASRASLQSAPDVADLSPPCNQHPRWLTCPLPLKSSNAACPFTPD